MRGSIVLERQANAHVRRGVALIAQPAVGARPPAIPTQVTICPTTLRMKGKSIDHSHQDVVKELPYLQIT